MLIEFGLQISKVNVSGLITGNDNDLHSGHHCAGSIGSMGRRWNQADGSEVITVCAVVGANSQ
ncbi:unannotated protein [freshwater metagenome]|uniref:Unannotated protein n=1 Tax=freshwater metagenome TaxID=449393 RepID=A0A6J6WGV0_9ZZZZ